MKAIFTNFYTKTFFSYIFMKTIVSLLIILGIGAALYVNSDTTLSFEAYITVLEPYFLVGIEFLILAMILWRANKKAGLQFRKPSIKGKDALYAVYGYIAITILSALLVYISQLLGLYQGSANQEAVGSLFGEVPILMGLNIVLIAPVLEEFVFRKGFIGHVFSSRPYAGLIVSSILFGSMHMMAGFSLMAFLQYTMMGAVFGLIYIKSGKIETAMLAHVLNNLVAVIGLMVLA